MMPPFAPARARTVVLAALLGFVPVSSGEAADTDLGVARTTVVPACSLHVDASVTEAGDGSAARPFGTIAEAVRAAPPAAVICVAEGVYPEEIVSGDKPFTLAGGFESGTGFAVRDSAAFVSRAQGSGRGSFLSVLDPAPARDQLTAVDGFEITGYEQAIVRAFWESQRFEITNNHIHDNACTDMAKVGAAFALENVSGLIAGNVIERNSCGRGGGGFVNDALDENTVTIEANRVEANSGVEPDSAHGGGLYLFANRLVVRRNLILGNTVAQWGGGIFVGAFTAGGQHTTAELAWNVYRGNRAGNSGGGFFCDDGATCNASHEIYDRNCGGNIMVDGGASGSGPTTATFTNVTSIRALEADCATPGAGIFLNTHEPVAPDTYRVADSIFWGNGEGRDVVTACGSNCDRLSFGIARSLVQRIASEGGASVDFGPGIVDAADPLFGDVETGDLRLRAGSPAAGKGAGGTDLGAFGGRATSEDIDRALAAAALAGRADGGAGAPPAAPRAAPAPAARSAPAAEAAVAAPIARETPVDDAAIRFAFEAARQLDTIDGWRAYLRYYPDGFYADLARGYLAKLGASAVAPGPQAETGRPGLARTAAGTAIAHAPRAAAVARGGDYMGFRELFNRYYTDPDWRPLAMLYASPAGGGDGSSPSAAATAGEAFAAARPGTMIELQPGDYQGGLEFDRDGSGTYDQPIVVRGARGGDGSIAVRIDCTAGRRQVCINLEGADYVAVDGIELIGGRYGVRSVGIGHASSEHARGIAVLNSVGHDQERDPFFTGHSDWAVFEGNVAYGAKSGDGHGFYISNGSDWNIARFNETWGNASSDFQINADPLAVCAEEGIDFADPQCDDYAGESEGGRGASDYMLVDGNYFHHGEVGPNFTGVRRSIVRNNVFGPQSRHNASFWQETDNPKLASSDNLVLHNLFLTTGRHAVQFINGSTRNRFVNNVLVGFATDGGRASANPSALLMEVDDTVAGNVYAGNVYVSGTVEGREPNDGEAVIEAFSPSWFVSFPTEKGQDFAGFSPAGGAPFRGTAVVQDDAPVDAAGVARAAPADPGPFEGPD